MKINSIRQVPESRQNIFFEHEYVRTNYPSNEYKIIYFTTNHNYIIRKANAKI